MKTKVSLSGNIDFRCWVVWWVPRSELAKVAAPLSKFLSKFARCRTFSANIISCHHHHCVAAAAHKLIDVIERYDLSGIVADDARKEAEDTLKWFKHV